MPRLAFVREIEEAAMSSWPALSTVFDGRWIVRLSEGHTGRANSVNVLDSGDGGDAVGRLARSADLFRRRALRPTLRATPLTPPSVVAAAEGAGWLPEGESLVMTMPLHPEPGHRTAAQLPAGSVTPEWLAAVGACMAFSEAKQQAIGSKLAVLGLEAGFFLHRDEDGAPVATGLGVVSRAHYLVGIMDLGVRPDARRQGHGSAVLAEILAWGAQHFPGGCHAWLQVSADNEPAIALYRRRGFAEGYRYRYFREPMSQQDSP